LDVSERRAREALIEASPLALVEFGLDTSIPVPVTIAAMPGERLPEPVEAAGTT